MKIVFLIGSFVVSGGNYVIFQHAMHASDAGHDVTLAAMSPFEASQLTWHPSLSRLKIRRLDEKEDWGSEEFDLVIATYWRTVLELHRFRSRQYAYFVQSIESRFFPASQQQLCRLVDRTYDLGLPGVTEATWIRDYLRRHYGSEFLLAHNGIRKDFYRPDGPSHAQREPGRLRVLVEGPFSSKMKNTARSVVLSRRSGADETWLLTSTDMRWYPRVSKVFSRIPIERVAEVYRSCDVILKLSFVEGMFGPPLEMFHCGGTAVVYDVSGHDEYIADGRNALVARMNDEAAVLAHLRRLREDPPFLARLKEGARETAAAWPDWPESSALFVRHLEAIREAQPVPRDRLVDESAKMRREFADCLRPPAGADRAKPRGWVSTGVQRLKDRVRPLKTMVNYIAEGYEERYDHTRPMVPAEPPRAQHAQEVAP